jgi:hypothetical protein
MDERAVYTILVESEQVQESSIEQVSQPELLGASKAET